MRERVSLLHHIRARNFENPVSGRLIGCIDAMLVSSAILLRSGNERGKIFQGFVEHPDGFPDATFDGSLRNAESVGGLSDFKAFVIDQVEWLPQGFRKIID